MKVYTYARCAREGMRLPRGLFREANATLNCRQAPAAITHKGYDALPAWCDCIRSRVGPEHIIMFVIYSLGVTLAGNS